MIAGDERRNQASVRRRDSYQGFRAGLILAMSQPAVSPNDSQREKVRPAHVVFAVSVGYSILATDQQNRAVQPLQSMARELAGFADALAAEELICIPTGDGMAIVCFGEPTAPVESARDLAIRVPRDTSFRLRIGLHNGPRDSVQDLEEWEVKHGVRLRIFNLSTPESGNASVPRRNSANGGRSAEWATALTGRT